MHPVPEVPAAGKGRKKSPGAAYTTPAAGAKPPRPAAGRDPDKGDHGHSHPIFGERVLFRTARELNPDEIAGARIQRLERKYYKAAVEAGILDHLDPSLSSSSPEAASAAAAAAAVYAADLNTTLPAYNLLVSLTEDAELRGLLARCKRRGHSGLPPCLQCGLRGLWCSFQWAEEAKKQKESSLGARAQHRYQQLGCLRCRRNGEPYCIEQWAADATASAPARARLVSLARREVSHCDSSSSSSSSSSLKLPPREDRGRRPAAATATAPLFCRDPTLTRRAMLLLATDLVENGGGGGGRTPVVFDVCGLLLYRTAAAAGLFALPMWHRNDACRFEDGAAAGARAGVGDKAWAEYFLERRRTLAVARNLLRRIRNVTRRRLGPGPGARPRRSRATFSAVAATSSGRRRRRLGDNTRRPRTMVS